MKLACLYEGLGGRIKVGPKVRIKPKKEEPKMKTRELSDEEKKLRKQAAELRAKIAARDPELTTTTRLRPTGYETEKAPKS